MPRLLWVDDEYGDFPNVHDFVSNLGWEIRPVFSVAAAYELLAENPGVDAWDCLLLDAIVPVGRTDVTPSVFADFQKRLHRPHYSDYRYAGFMLLDAFRAKKIAKKTVVLSLVPKDRLQREEECSKSIPIVYKLVLDLEELKKALEAV